MNPTDESLIADCLAGRTSAFGQIVSRYQDRLFHSVARLLNHQEDARDVVQETFLSAFQNLAGFKGDAVLFTWLYRIAVNTAISWKRKQKPALGLYDPERPGGVDPADPSVSVQPGHALETAEEERRIHAALARLSPEHRSVLVMKDMEGMKYEVMAEILQVPIGTIRSRLHRARLELRDLLVQEPTPEPADSSES